jgi:hypothetical protein
LLQELKKLQKNIEIGQQLYLNLFDAMKNVLIVYCATYRYSEEISNAIVSEIRCNKDIHIKVKMFMLKIIMK